ncbi:MAG: zinc ABC transporter substrate-binding protein, partial [Lachnospiraceae bacterium]|nr:zinc ABC transporter substrate-binding protein [Lachnospiraceae bacterium]
MKIAGLILVLCTSLCSLAACGEANADKGPAISDKKSIVCTIFPEYDWVKEVTGDKADDFEITLLLDNGVDIHNYQPSAADIVKIAS